MRGFLLTLGGTFIAANIPQLKTNKNTPVVEQSWAYEFLARRTNTLTTKEGVRKKLRDLGEGLGRQGLSMHWIISEQV